MRKAAISAAGILSALALAIFFWRIESFLPERGGTTCFAADYSPPRPIDLSSPRHDQRSVGEVSSMRLELFLSPDEKPFRDERAGRRYDWRYSLRLDARLAGSERLSTSAICEWTDTFVDRIMPALFCYIDCDGGSVTKAGAEWSLGAVRSGRAAEDGRQLRRRRCGIYRGGAGGKELAGRVRKGSLCGRAVICPRIACNLSRTI